MATQRRRFPGQELARRTIKNVRRYLLWNCSSCGTIGINANTCKQCFSCGNPKELDDRDEAEYRSSTPVNKNYKHKGADISCQSCGTENKKRFSCRNCGDTLDKKFSKLVKHFPATTDEQWRDRKVQVDVEGRVKGAADTPWDDDVVTLQEPPRPIRPSVRTQTKATVQKTTRAVSSLKQPEVRRDPRTWIVLAGVAVAFLIMISVGVWIYGKYNSFSQSSARVTSVAWSYSLPIEDYALRDKTHTTEDTWWRPPSEAVRIQDQRVIVRTEDIIESVYVEKTCTRTEDDSYNDSDGTWVQVTVAVDYDCSSYESQKVGEDDIWGTRWTYQLYEWQRTTPLTKDGTNHDVVFPSFTPTETLRASGEAVTTFTLFFSYENHKGVVETADRSIPFESWDKVSVDDSFPAIVDGFGTLRAIAGIDAEYSELYRQLTE